MRVLISITILALLTSCSSNLKILTPKDVTVATGDPQGAIIGSISHILENEKKLSGTAKLILLTEEGRRIQIKFSSHKDGDIKDKSQITQAFHIPVKPGNYRIKGVQFQWVQGTTLVTNMTRNKSIQFKVEENTSSYIGEFLVGSIWMDNIWKTMKVPTGASYAIITNQLDRDKEILIQKGSLNFDDNIDIVIDNTVKLNAL